MSAQRPSAGYSDATLERRYAALYDFALDIKLHEDDYEFSLPRNRVIHYVFDENTFELFINPLETSSYLIRDAEASISHLDRTPARRVMAAQSALICAEALVGGSLPGQKDGLIYLTDWHRWELLARLNGLMAHYSGRGAANIRDNAPAYLEQKLGVLSPGGADLDSWYDGNLDPFLTEDLKTLRALAKPGPEQEAAFKRNRIASALMSLNEDIEPVHQLNRLLDRSMQSRLKGLVTLKRPTGRELDNVARAARVWRRAIRQESEYRARLAKRKPRGKQAILNDASTIALLEWISSKLDPGTERIVFVTGDPTLYDAYRRRIERNPGRGQRGAGPFLLRRPLQYSPLFTIDAATESLDPHTRLFYSVQQAVELPMVSMQIAAIASRHNEDDILSRRYSLTLSPIDSEDGGSSYLSQAWTALGGTFSKDNISELERELDQFERILSGFSQKFILRRVSKEELAAISKAKGATPEDQRLILRAYVTQAIDRLMASAISVWRPLAQRAIRVWADREVASPPRKVPVAVNLVSGGDSTSVDLFDALNRFRGFKPGFAEQEPIAASLEAPFDVFLVSTAVALMSNQWRQADHFAEVAINAALHLGNRGDVTPRAAAEAYYLGAVAKRFRLGLLAPGEGLHAFHTAVKLYDTGNDLLESGRDLVDGSYRDYVVFRSASERAALNLFFSAFCVQQVELLIGVREAADAVKSACTSAFDRARKSLEECLAVQERLGLLQLEPSLSGTGEQMLRAQFLIGIAAWFALRPFVPEVSSLGKIAALARECREHLAELTADLDSPVGQVFLVDILAFKISEGIDVPASRERLAGINAQPMTEELPIENYWLSKMKAYWGGPSAPPSART